MSASDRTGIALIDDNGRRVALSEASEAHHVEAPEFSEEQIALSFAEQHVDDLRYVAPWGRWLRWNGRKWEFDHSLVAFDLTRQACRQAAAACNKPAQAATLASAKPVAAVERLAKADRRIAASVEQWDADPWLLNTPTGTIDLRSGKLRAHDPKDFQTRATAVAPGGDCPLWRTFLADVTGGDEALTAFLHRLAGYALTGSTREHSLSFVYGTGGNGKSVFIDTLAGILGDYPARVLAPQIGRPAFGILLIPLLPDPHPASALRRRSTCEMLQQPG